MPATFTPGPNLVTVEITNPERDDLGGVRIWASASTGFTPGPTNLVYDGPDLTVVLTDLAAGTPLYFRYALYSQIDPTDFDTSSEYSATPEAPAVAAEDIQAGDIRGSNVFSGAFSGFGTTASAASIAGAATVAVKTTADFAASGSALHIARGTGVRDVFAYTGKTATSLTGCTGTVAIASGDLVLPMKSNVILAIGPGGNELLFTGGYGNAISAGIAADGIAVTGKGTYLSVLGTPESAPSGYGALYARSSWGSYTVLAENTGSGHAIAGSSSTGSGVVGTSQSSGTGVFGSSIDGYAGRFDGGSSKQVLRLDSAGQAHLNLVPLSNPPSTGFGATLEEGDVFAHADLGPGYYDGVSWRYMLLPEIGGTTFGNPASGSTVSVPVDTRRYVNIASATKAALTFDLPAASRSGHTVWLGTRGAVTALTVRDSAGNAANVINAPASLAVGAFCGFSYRSSDGLWYRVG